MVNDRIFLVNASLGLYPTLLEHREEWKHYLGRNQLVAFCAAFFTLMREHRSLRLRLEDQTTARRMRTPMLIVGNNALQLQQLGLPTAQAIQQGELAGIVLRPLRRLTMLGLLLRGALGQLGDSEQVLSFPFKRLLVHGAWPFRERRIKVATDGEVEWLSMPLEFRVAPQSLLLVRPLPDKPDDCQ
jgi:diacylglycerol kinase family enzyme